MRLASFTALGDPGQVIKLQLTLDDHVLASLGPGVRIVVTMGDNEFRLPPREFVDSRNVFSFLERHDLFVTVAVTSNVSTVVPGRFVLTMTTNAAVENLVAPWGRPSPTGEPRLSITAGTCQLLAAAGTCGATTWSIAPFAVGNPFGDFQSQPGTGVSQPISITFSQPILSATVTAVDPTFAGNQVQGFLAGALVSSQAFAFSGTPGVNVPDTKTVPGPVDRIDLIPAPADYVAYSASITVDSAQALIVECAPTTLTRGDTVRCTAKLAQPQDFTVTLREALGRGLVVVDTTVESIPAGGEAVWEGVAAATSAVEFTVEFDSSGQTIQETNQPVPFTVNPRTWPAWEYTTLQFRFVAFAGNMRPYPDSGAIGLFQPLPPPTRNLTITRPPSGPNESVAFVTNPYTVTDYQIAVHPALDLRRFPPGSRGFAGAQRWVRDQNGRGSGNCTQASIPRLLAEVERHEGYPVVVPNSHPGVSNPVFLQEMPQNLIETLFTQGRDAQLRGMVDAQVRNFLRRGPYAAAQRLFDQRDTRRVLGSAGCTFDFNPRDN